MKPFYIPVYASNGCATFSDPMLEPLFATLMKKNKSWKNAFTPRFLFHAPRYQQGTIEKLKMPILFCLAEKDLEVSNTFVKSVAAKAKNATVLEYPYGHFEMYHGKALDQVRSDQVEFLRLHLLA